MSRARVFVIVLVFALCAVASATAETLQPAGWDANLRLPVATDINDDPRIVEVSLEAGVTPIEIVPGKPTNVWAYNGGLPGPLIRANVGDRVIVRFSNKLPQPTTIHWHGVQVPIEMDGVPGISQPDVEPGGSFTYDFIVPDAGLFWYHPHVMSAAQVGFGLYGALLVDDPDDRLRSMDELILVLGDIAVDEETGAMHPPTSGGILGTLFGREGNYTLVNGRRHPTLAIRDGALQRWRIVNTAKSRYFKLALGDAQPFTLIGVDGGLLEYSEARGYLVLAPGERMDVLVAPRFQSREPLVLTTLPFDRGFGSTEFRSSDDLLTFTAAPLPSAPPVPVPRVARAIRPMTSAGATPIRLDLVLNKSQGAFAIQGGPFWRGSAVRAAIGETQFWTITNKAVWAHPIHLHGFFFQVVDEAGIPVRPLAWKDTISVPADATVRVLVRFDRPGSWMYHCHILDHAEAGLMSTVDVGDVKPLSSGHKH
jgi:FtsP/CotA-like multicopper oxidase with cupredoxin domain